MSALEIMNGWFSIVEIFKNSSAELKVKYEEEQVINVLRKYGAVEMYSRVY